MNKTTKVLLKIFLSIVAVPISLGVLRIIWGLYKIQTISTNNLGSLTVNPLDLVMNLIFIIALFAVPGLLIWLIWKKI